MNLYQYNSGVDEYVMRNARHDLTIYINFLQQAIELLERQALPIKVKEVPIIQSEKESKKNKVVGFKYVPLEAGSKKDERAIDILFNENTSSVFDQNKNFSPPNQINILEKNEDDNFVILHRKISDKVIYLKPDTYQLRQQKKAIDNLRYKPLKEHAPLLNLFGYPDSEFWDFIPNKAEIKKWHILTDDNVDGITEQRDFVSKAIKSPDFALMEGPPGSGKTTTIIELIMQFIESGKRVLLCSATHAAIDNVLERINERYKNICSEHIVPVRISRFEKPVKENVRPYLLKNLIRTYKKEIENFLKQNQDLDSQKYLLENLYGEDKNGTDHIGQIILDSANLVAGTMVGILQHPDIRSNNNGASFDVLIVDEASKVTFADFIVPALHAKSWILVGDVKQLSPYVENEYTAEYLNNFIDGNEQKQILDFSELQLKLIDERYQKVAKVFFHNDSEISYKVERFMDDLYYDHHIVELNDSWNDSSENILSLNAANVILAENSPYVRKVLSKYLHVRSIFINGTPDGQNQKWIQSYLHNNYRYPIDYPFSSRDENWGNLVASKLSQAFSFRNDGNFSHINKELDLLIPEYIRPNIDELKRLFFPSILELLQNGVGKSSNQRNDRIISDGFSDYSKLLRFESLSYQHRMHPDIARVSKDNFYESNLKSSSIVSMDRGWKYAAQEDPVLWIHNNDSTGNNKNGRIINPTELRDIERELKSFISWAEINPKPDKTPYSLAVLCFYIHQETELRRMIRRICSSNAHSKFSLANIDLCLYTVDKFQGQEADFVMLGFTKFTQNAHFSSPNRLNVALTRARHKLLLFGNKKWFSTRAKLKALRDLSTNYKSKMKLEL